MPEQRGIKDNVQRFVNLLDEDPTVLDNILKMNNTNPLKVVNLGYAIQAILFKEDLGRARQFIAQAEELGFGYNAWLAYAYHFVDNYKNGVQSIKMRVPDADEKIPVSTMAETLEGYKRATDWRRKKNPQEADFMLAEIYRSFGLTRTAIKHYTAILSPSPQDSEYFQAASKSIVECLLELD